MAFLPRVLNGGAHIAREFATGRQRVDRDLFHAGRHHPIELKLLRCPKSRQEGLEQIAGHCAPLGCDDGWTGLFDHQSERTWDEPSPGKASR